MRKKPQITQKEISRKNDSMINFRKQIVQKECQKFVRRVLNLKKILFWKSKKSRERNLN